MAMPAERLHRPPSDSPARRIGRLSSIASALTFLLIILGGIVRLSDSGLGCGPAGSGTHGWPLCNGRLIPIDSAHTIIEYSHRALAGLITLAVVALVVLVWRTFRANRLALRLSLLALAAILIQAALGGLTVERNLDELLVGVHLALAMGLLGLLLALRKAVATPASSAVSAKSSPDRGLKGLAIVTGCALILAIAAGGYMAGTEGHGRTIESTHSAHMACGNTFPACNGKFLPFGSSRLVDIHLYHRLLVYMTALMVLLLFAYALLRIRDSKVTLYAGFGVGILGVQVVLGGLQVWIGDRGWLVLLHLIAATVLWSWIVLFGLQLVGHPATFDPKPVTGRVA